CVCLFICVIMFTTVPGELTGCLVKETLKAGSSLRGEGYILLRIRKPGLYPLYHNLHQAP
uniref:Uncharacterized protein n=1 Tax=Labrus bergylta TaxID=56723 RepID=A0A3Q3F4W6_9LABR